MTTTSIPALLEPIQGRLNKATPGPWKTVRHDLSLYVVAESGELNPINLGYVGNRPERDAEFIAHSPMDTARLLAAVKAVDEFIQDAAERSPRELIPVPTVAGLLRNVVEAELRGEA